MKAVACTAYGSPEVLQFVDIPKPEPTDDQILVKVRSTTVAVADSRLRSLNVPKGMTIPVRLAIGVTKPRKSVMGVESAGVVEKVGKDVKEYKVGDEIFAESLSNFGAHAEYLVLGKKDPKSLKPAELSFDEAAALPIGARTALFFLQKADAKDRKKVLIYGASGSVGTYAVQMAANFGCEVTGVCSEGNFDLVKSLGAMKTISYKAPDFEKQLEKYDLVFLAIDKLPFAICHRILNDGGVYVNITYPFMNLHQMRVSFSGKKKIIMGQSVPNDPKLLSDIKEMIERKKLKVVIDKSFPFEEIREAHRYVDQGHKKGNVVVRVS